MRIDSLIKSNIKYLDGYEVENLDTKILEAIKQYNLSEKNIKGSLLYNRGEYKELSIFTSPNKSIIIRINKV